MSLAPEQDLEEARARWRSAVTAVLAKSTRRDRSDLPAEPERLLDSPTYEGFAVRALYTALDCRPESPLPGQWPFTRGADRDRDVLCGWKVAEEFGSPGVDSNAVGANAVNANAVNEDVLTALADGVSALIMRVGPGGLAVADLPRALEGVYLELAPVQLDVLSGGAPSDSAPSESTPSVFRAAADALLELAANSGGVGSGAAGSIPLIDLGADPVTAPLGNRTGASVDDVLAVALAAAGTPGVRTVTVDGPVFHNLGAGAGWELAGVVATGVEYLRLLTGAGLSAADALRQISFRLAADDDQFMTIAKFRAARLLWGRVAEAMGQPDSGAVRLHAVTSMPMMTQRDPWVNMLRTTLAAFGAGVGGADTVRVLPFDSAIPGGYPGVQEGFPRRIARNTQLLLLEESHLGRVRDAAGGSWYVEDLTESLAAQAWSHFQEIEALGGFRNAQGFVRRQIEEIAGRRAADIAYRRTAITGVNEFPNLAEPVLLRTDSPDGEVAPAIDRYASAFEALRNRSDAYLERTGSRPQVLLLPLGPLAEHNVRATFTANLLACGGIESVNPGSVAAADVTGAVGGRPGAAGDRDGAEGKWVAVVCGSDSRYLEELADVVTAARAAGCLDVYLAGQESTVATTLAEAPAGARPDGYLNAKVDAVQALSALLTRLGA